MKKSASVTLTVVAAMGIAARAQQQPDPCDTATFNQKMCRKAIKSGGYCWNGQWVTMTYSNPYPYFYDQYQGYLAAGGAVSAMPAEVCRRPSTRFTRVGGGHGSSRGGFGASGAGHCSS